jgi:hypothetical protein
MMNETGESNRLDTAITVGLAVVTALWFVAYGVAVLWAVLT